MSERVSTIGIDPSVRAPALAVWPSRETYQLDIPGEGPERLRTLYARIHDHLLTHCPDDLLAVFIERPTGRFPQPALYQANGVIQVAAMNALEQRFPHPVSLFELSPGGWKKAIGLSGAAKKADVSYWAAKQGETAQDSADLALISQDRCDALAIAAAGYFQLQETATKGEGR